MSVNAIYDVIPQVRDELCERFESKLRKLLPKLEKASEGQITEGINRIIELEATPPVFVTFKQEGGGTVDDLIADISREFPSLRIIFCTATEQDRAILPSNIHMLKPELCLADEKQAFDAYLSVVLK